MSEYYILSYWRICNFHVLLETSRQFGHRYNFSDRSRTAESCNFIGRQPGTSVRLSLRADVAVDGSRRETRTRRKRMALIALKLDEVRHCMSRPDVRDQFYP